MGNKYKKWINFPKSYDLVVGDTFEMFYRGVIRCGDVSRYNIKITCAKGAYFTNKYMFTPTENDIGKYPLTLEISDDYGDVLDTDTVELIVYPQAKSPDEDTYILCVGDSLTAGGQWVSECYRRLTASDGEPKGLGLERVHFVGGRKGQFGSWYEGYGGWKFDNYNEAHMNQDFIKYIYTNHNKTVEDQHSTYTDGASLWKLEDIEEGRIKVVYSSYARPLADSGVLKHSSGGIHHEDIVYDRSEIGAGNPFWDVEKDCVDYIGYAKKHGAPRIDIMVVMLGWNSWWQPEKHIREQIHLFFDNFRAQYPDCKIVFVGPHISSHDGLGISYGCLFNYMEKIDFAMNMDGWFREIAAEYKDMYYVNMTGQFDSENNFPTLDRPVNARSSVIETISCNGLHPTNEGYEQISDLVFRKLNALLCEINREKENGQ